MQNFNFGRNPCAYVRLDVSRLRAALAGRGLTLSALAKRCGFSAATACRIGRGEYCRLSTLSKISLELDVPPDELILNFD